MTELRDRAPRIAVAGVGGYVGGELLRLLDAHPRLRESAPLLLGRAADEARTSLPLEVLHPQLARGGAASLRNVEPFSWSLVEQAATELVFLALPHESSRAEVPDWLRRAVRVIDLSGAWRLGDPRHAHFYGFVDADPGRAAATQAEAVFGCPELVSHETIANARLIANPGCYSTSILLALAPLLRAGLVDCAHGIICDAKSGVSGAGKTPTARTHFMAAADNLSAYAPFGHRHTGELLEQLGLADHEIQFTPHLLPIPRGILSTLYLRLREPSSPEAIESCLRSFYAACPMVRIRPDGELPEIAHILRTNFCDIGFALAPDRQRLLVVSCLDNLGKGAAGQAIQNMNLMCGWPEDEGLL